MMDCGGIKGQNMQHINCDQRHLRSYFLKRFTYSKARKRKNKKNNHHSARLTKDQIFKRCNFKPGKTHISLNYLHKSIRNTWISDVFSFSFLFPDFEPLNRFIYLIFFTYRINHEVRWVHCRFMFVLPCVFIMRHLKTAGIVSAWTYEWEIKIKSESVMKNTDWIHTRHKRCLNGCMSVAWEGCKSSDPRNQHISDAF